MNTPNSIRRSSLEEFGGHDGPVNDNRMDIDFEESGSSQNKMFKRAQNREFLGMSESAELLWKGNYDFICMGDAQIGMYDKNAEEEFCRVAVGFINKRKDSIKFVVICGDLTHNLEGMWSKGDVEGGRKKRLEELKSFKQVYSKLDESIPLVCVCGNHDVGNKPTRETTDMFKEEFGDDYFSFWCGGVKFFVLNSQIIQGLSPIDQLSIDHENWADKAFEAEHKFGPIHSVVMCHIPPFCWDPEEKHTNFNFPKDKRVKWLDKMLEANVKKVYCSHYHRRAGGKYKELEVVVTGAIGTQILTKNVPSEFKASKLDEINFKLSYEGFGGVEANEESSGLLVVTVSKEGLSEEWINVKKMRMAITM